MAGALPGSDGLNVDGLGVGVGKVGENRSPVNGEPKELDGNVDGEALRLLIDGAAGAYPADNGKGAFTGGKGALTGENRAEGAGNGMEGLPKLLTGGRGRSGVRFGFKTGKGPVMVITDSPCSLKSKRKPP